MLSVVMLFSAFIIPGGAVPVADAADPRVPPALYLLREEIESGAELYAQERVFPFVTDMLAMNEQWSEMNISLFSMGAPYLYTYTSLLSGTKSGTLSHAQIQTEIDAKRPIYLGTYGSGGYQGGRNALVLRGYTATSYSVWNPWNENEYANMDKSSQKLVVLGGGLTWDKTIYNWRELNPKSAKQDAA